MPAVFAKNLGTALAGAVLATVLCASAAHAQVPAPASGPAAPGAQAAPASAHLGLFRYDYAGGTSYEVRFDSDSSLHWDCIAGDEKGRQADETYDRVRLRGDQHLLSWTEADGLSVTQVIDYRAGTVDTVLTLPGTGERIVLKGSIRRI